MQKQHKKGLKSYFQTLQRIFSLSQPPNFHLIEATLVIMFLTTAKMLKVRTITMVSAEIALEWVLFSIKILILFWIEYSIHPSNSSEESRREVAKLDSLSDNVGIALPINVFEFLQTHFVQGQNTDSESDEECDTIQNENVDGGTKHLLRLAQTEQVESTM